MRIGNAGPYGDLPQQRRHHAFGLPKYWLLAGNEVAERYLSVTYGATLSLRLGHTRGKTTHCVVF